MAPMSFTGARPRVRYPRRPDCCHQQGLQARQAVPTRQRAAGLARLAGRVRVYCRARPTVARQSQLLDLDRAPYVLYGGKYIDLVSL